MDPLLNVSTVFVSVPKALKVTPIVDANVTIEVRLKKACPFLPTFFSSDACLSWAVDRCGQQRYLPCGSLKLRVIVYGISLCVLC